MSVAPSCDASRTAPKATRKACRGRCGAEQICHRGTEQICHRGTEAQRHRGFQEFSRCLGGQFSLALRPLTIGLLSLAVRSDNAEQHERVAAIAATQTDSGQVLEGREDRRRAAVDGSDLVRRRRRHYLSSPLLRATAMRWTSVSASSCCTRSSRIATCTPAFWHSPFNMFSIAVSSCSASRLT